MCYPPPGPRCSSHANAEWLKALASLEKETDTNKRIRLQMKADEAFRAFNATPRGQNRLLREINSLNTDSDNKDELAKLSLQLRDGQLTRKNQLAAFLAVKHNKESSIKALLKTSNKQEQAVGIAFHVLMRFLPETIGDNAHILPNNLIQIADAKILCAPQKHQRYFGTIKEEDNEYLSSTELPAGLLNIFADFAEPTTITQNHIPELMGWFIEEQKKQGILYLASVDVKTENVIFDRIDNILDHYKVSFIQKKKLGGTAPYIHGDTELLRDSISGSSLAACAITVATVKDQKRTYILEAPSIEPAEFQSSYFHLAERHTPDGSRFYEVRTKHQPSQWEIVVRFSRRALVISKTDEMLVKKFILDSFGSAESSESPE